MPKRRGITEAEWQSCADPRPMQEAPRGKASERTLRLFALACCRRLGPLLQDPRITTALDVAERYADGAASQADLEAARRVRPGLSAPSTGRRCCTPTRR
jgi:hypothetical protein